MLASFLCLSLIAHATPTPTTLVANTTAFPFYYPDTRFRSFNIIGVNSLLSSDKDAVAVGRAALIKELGVGNDDLEILQYHRDTSSQVVHVYGRHIINGIPVDNQGASVHVLNGNVLALSTSFQGNHYKPVQSLMPMKLSDAVKIAEDTYKIPRDSYPAKQVYLQTKEKILVLCHQFQLRNAQSTEWLQVSVDENGNIVQTVDYFKKATYKAIKLPHNDPTDGFETITDPAAGNASPSGWHSDGVTSYTDTQGNNADSHVDSTRIDGGSSLNFDSAFDATQEPTTTANVRAAIINNFYIVNKMHDISYQFGFTESAGNLQQKNFGKGGNEGDRVVVNNHASGIDNANMATPADGQSAVMNMYLWDQSTPQRDGSLEAGVVAHEYTHGISNRLTGGSAQANCLESTESGGMGEGWSDTLALYIERKATDTRSMDVILGAYVYNNPAGIRSKPYSTDMKVNPYTLSYVATQNEVHAIGELWANVLFEVYWNLVDLHGFSENLLDATQKTGNIMALQVVIGGLKIQPCNPTFLTARDAILAADVAYYGGLNKCALWSAFAKRGMGVDAINAGYKDGFAVPPECNNGQTPPPSTPSTTTVEGTVTITSKTKKGPKSTKVPCVHDKCVIGDALNASCDSCVAKIISKDSFCGTSSWDSNCVGEVKSVCQIKC